MVNERDQEFGWDAEIENDGAEFILLPPGDYDFVVETFERARHEASEKLPACPQAIVHLKINTPEGDTTIKHNLFLHTKTEGLLCAFFSAIGQRKKGEKISMNWTAVPGSTGRAKIIQKELVSKQTGETFKVNQVARFYDKDEAERNRNMDAALKSMGFTEIPEDKQESFNIGTSSASSGTYGNPRF